MKRPSTIPVIARTTVHMLLAQSYLSSLASASYLVADRLLPACSFDRVLNIPGHCILVWCETSN